MPPSRNCPLPVSLDPYPGSVLPAVLIVNAGLSRLRDRWGACGLNELGTTLGSKRRVLVLEKVVVLVKVVLDTMILEDIEAD